MCEAHEEIVRQYEQVWNVVPEFSLLVIRLIDRIPRLPTRVCGSPFARVVDILWSLEPPGLALLWSDFTLPGRAVIGLLRPLLQLLSERPEIRLVELSARNGPLKV